MKSKIKIEKYLENIAEKVDYVSYVNLSEFIAKLQKYKEKYESGGFERLQINFEKYAYDDPADYERLKRKFEQNENKN